MRKSAKVIQSREQAETRPYTDSKQPDCQPLTQAILYTALRFSRPVVFLHPAKQDRRSKYPAFPLASWR
jgi:hypothetical protein